MLECTFVAEASATGHWIASIKDLGDGDVFCVSGDDKFLLDLSWRQLEPKLFRICLFFPPLPLKASDTKTLMTFRAWPFSLGDETQWDGEETGPVRVACLVLTKTIMLLYMVVFSEIIVDSLITSQEDAVLFGMSLFFRE